MSVAIIAIHPRLTNSQYDQLPYLNYKDLNLKTASVAQGLGSFKSSVDEKYFQETQSMTSQRLNRNSSFR